MTPFTIGFSVSSVLVLNQDDDTAGITVSPTAGLVTDEDGGADQFWVVLDSEPSADVRIVLFSDDMEEGTVSPTALVFTAENWDEAQTVRVTGVGDSADDGDTVYTILLRPATSMDEDYLGMDADDVTVTNLDDDTGGISLSWLTQPVTTEGGGTALFEVALDTEPTSKVTVTVWSDDETEGTVSPASLVFSTLDWNELRTVTVRGLNDDVDDGDEGYAIRMDVSSDDLVYDGIDAGDVTFTNTDDDTAGVSVGSAMDLTTKESGDKVEFTLFLTASRRRM